MSDDIKHEIQLFNYGENAVRTVRINEEVWFIAKDICDVLELVDVTSALRTLDDDEKLIRTISGLGINRGVNLISESGLYNLVFVSRKPEAKKFRKWVTSEVLPSIRKTGSYSTRPQLSNGMIREGWKIVHRALNAKSAEELSDVERFDKAFKNYTGQSALANANVLLDELKEKMPELPPLTEWQQQIVNYLSEHETVTPNALGKALGLNVNTAGNQLLRMLRKGLLKRIGFGRYALNKDC